MPVVYAQSIAEQKVAPQTEVKVVKKTETQQLVDEYADLYQKLEASGMKPVMKRMEELSKSLRAKVDEIGADPTKPYVFNTPESTVEFSACTNSLEITDRKTMIAKLGQDTFNQVAKVGVTELKKYLSPVEIQSFSVGTYGHRTVKSVVVKSEA